MDRREYKREYRRTHKEQVRQYQRTYYKIYSRKHPEKIKEWTNNARARAKYETLHHYSGGKMCCECCGEKTYEFLSIDHIRGDGGKHRKTFSGSIFVWLKARSYPIGYRVLCFNCNLALGFYGYCPHGLCKGEITDIERKGQMVFI